MNFKFARQNLIVSDFAKSKERNELARQDIDEVSFKEKLMKSCE